MRAKITDLFQHAMGYALNGDVDETREYLSEYESRIMAVARKMEELKKECQQLEAEHGAICVVLGANRK